MLADPQHHFDEIDYNLQSERSRLSLGKNAAVKITSESFPEYPYDYDMMTSVNLHGTRYFLKLSMAISKDREIRCMQAYFLFFSNCSLFVVLNVAGEERIELFY